MIGAEPTVALAHPLHWIHEMGKSFPRDFSESGDSEKLAHQVEIVPGFWVDR
jgi:hypothetical protein